MTALACVSTLTLLLTSPQAPAATTPGSTANTFRLADGAQRPAARTADLSWLVGAMVGFFRLVREGKPVFYEILTIIEIEGSLEMRLKHVNPDMTGWEEKSDFVTFKLAKHDASGAYFDGLTFKRVNPDLMEGYLALRNRSDGTVREEKFVYRRVK
jgi:hypothetical protein